MAELLEALRWRASAAHCLRLIVLIGTMTTAILIAVIALAEATSVSIVVVQALIWVGWLAWLGFVFPHNGRRDSNSPRPYRYRRAFFREILLGISIAFSQFLRPAVAGLFHNGTSAFAADALIVGVPLLAAGATMLIAGVSVLGVARTLFVHEYTPDRREVVRAGIYRFVRHPLFIGGALLSLGLAICTGAEVAIQLALLNTLVCPLYVRLEDGRCTAILGRDYVDYSTAVGGAVPRRRSLISSAAHSRKPAGSIEPIAGRAHVSRR